MGHSLHTMNAITLLTLFCLAAVFALWARLEAAELARPVLERVRVKEDGGREAR